MKTYIFCCLLDTGTGFTYPWMLRVDSEESLLDYHVEIVQSMARKSISDCLQSRELAKAMGKTTFGPHLRTAEGHAVLLRAKRKNLSVAHAAADLYGEVQDQQKQALEKAGCLYINRNGGYFPASASIKEVQTQTATTLVWPDTPAKEARVLQWPRGTHWYAKIGNLDVIDEAGNRKWNTHAEATQALTTFIGRK